jgi:paraquat-inducible protein B
MFDVRRFVKAEQYAYIKRKITENPHNNKLLIETKYTLIVNMESNFRNPFTIDFKIHPAGTQRKLESEAKSLELLQ